MSKFQSKDEIAVNIINELGMSLPFDPLFQEVTSLRSRSESPDYHHSRQRSRTTPFEFHPFFSRSSKDQRSSERTEETAARQSSGRRRSTHTSGEELVQSSRTGSRKALSGKHHCPHCPKTFSASWSVPKHISVSSFQQDNLGKLVVENHCADAHRAFFCPTSLCGMPFFMTREFTILKGEYIAQTASCDSREGRTMIGMREKRIALALIVTKCLFCWTVI